VTAMIVAADFVMPLFSIAVFANSATIMAEAPSYT
jgi:hypothetical protein